MAILASDVQGARTAGLRTEVKCGEVRCGGQVWRSKPVTLNLIIHLSSSSMLRTRRLQASGIPPSVSCALIILLSTHRVAPVDIRPKGQEQIGHRDVAQRGGDKQGGGTFITLCVQERGDG